MLVVSALPSSGCEASEPPQDTRPAVVVATPAASAGRAPARGDEVLVEERAAEFFQATVQRVLDSGNLRVQRRDGRIVDVPVVDARRLPPPPTGPLAAGTRLVCRLAAGRWEPCRVLEPGPPVRVEDLVGATHVLTQTTYLLRPEGLTAENVAARFADADAQRMFFEDARRAGRPRAPSGWLAAPQERVLAEVDGSWSLARVTRIRDDGSYRVRWDRDGREAEVAANRVVPEPPHPGSSAERGDFGLLRPSVPAAPWLPVRVKSVQPTLLVVDARGRSSEIQPRELLLLRSLPPR